MGKGAICSGGDKDDKSKEYPDFANDSNRKCTDILFCVVFIVFLVGMLGVAGAAISQGNYIRLVNGIDYRGCICGTSVSFDKDGNCTESSDGTQLGNLAVPVLVPFLNQDSTLAALVSDVSPVLMCATACPTSESAVICNAGFKSTPSATDLTSWTAEQKINCGFAAKSSKLFRYCVPETLKNATVGALAKKMDATLDKVRDNAAVSQAFASLGAAAVPILISSLAAVLFGFVFLYLLEKVINCLVLTAMLLSIALMAGGGFMLTGRAAAMAESGVDTSDTSYATNLYGGYALYAIAGLLVIFYCCMRKRIMLATAAMKTASRCVRAQPTMLIVPLVSFFLTGAFCAIWLYIAVNLFSAGRIVADDAPGLPSGVNRSIELDKSLQYAFIYHLLGLFWVTQYVVAMGQLILAGCAAAWYFQTTEDGAEKQGVDSVVTKATKRAFKHSGSAAFGSLIIAIIQLLRAIATYLDAKSKKITKDNAAVKVVRCFIHCYLYCLEKCMKFINKNAYIQIACYGNLSFCAAARNAFFLIARNVLRIGAVKVVGGVFLVLGKVFIMAFGAFFAFLLLTQVSTWADPSSEQAVPSAFIPVLFVLIIGYQIGDSLMSVYGMTIDTILMAFIIDEEIGGDEGPRYADGALAKFVDETEAKAREAGITSEHEEDGGKKKELASEDSKAGDKA